MWILRGIALVLLVAVTHTAAAQEPIASLQEPIASLQELLASRGCDVGAADGAWGRRTTIAAEVLSAYSGIAIERPVTEAVLASLRDSDARCPAVFPVEGVEVKAGTSPGPKIVTGFRHIMREAFTSPKPHGMLLVPDPLGGTDTTLRVELRYGDCGKMGDWDDCKNGRDRVELISEDYLKVGDTRTYRWEMYVPEGFGLKGAASIVLGQLHQLDSIDTSFLMLYEGVGLHIRRLVKSAKGSFRDDKDTIIAEEALRGRWYAIEWTVFWTDTEAGYLSISVDGQPTYRYDGPTTQDGHKGYFKIGVYRFKTSALEPPAIVYYRNIRQELH